MNFMNSQTFYNHIYVCYKESNPYEMSIQINQFYTHLQVILHAKNRLKWYFTRLHQNFRKSLRINNATWTFQEQKKKYYLQMFTKLNDVRVTLFHSSVFMIQYIYFDNKKPPKLYYVFSEPLESTTKSESKCMVLGQRFMR